MNLYLRLRILISTGKLNLAGIQRVEVLILLVKDLGAEIPEYVPKRIQNLLSSLQLPSLKFLPIPVLKKKKFEKEALLSDSWGCATEDNILCAMRTLKSKILIPAYQTVIESIYFEITYWRSRLRKVAGNYLIIIINHYFIFSTMQN